MIKELRKDFDENGIANFEVNDVACLFNQIAELRRSLDNIKVRAYELGQPELHDMALAALSGKVVSDA